MPENGRGSEEPEGSQAPASFEAFARAGQRRLYRTGYLLCGNPDAARNLTQTTLAKLFQHWRRASAPDHIEVYARTVPTRTYLAERRRRLRDLLAYSRPDPRTARPCRSAGDSADRTPGRLSGRYRHRGRSGRRRRSSRPRRCVPSRMAARDGLRTVPVHRGASFPGSEPTSPENGMKSV